MVHLRRHLHLHPEVSEHEYETTQLLGNKLRDAGYDIQLGPDKRGVIATPASLSQSTLNRPCIALRADIDALHIHDAKSCAYRSTRDGVMHACGHDAHSAIVMGAALALAQQNDSNALPCPVNWRIIFQPAEETASGALEMIDAGAVKGVDTIFALHVDPTRKVGTVGVKPGVATANCDEVVINIVGRGGHASRPHESLDPIAAAAQFISAVYQFVPRAIDSHHQVIITFGQIRGGENYNVIPESVYLRGTMRSFDEDVRARSIERINTLARGIAEASQTKIDIKFKSGPPAVINHLPSNEILQQAAVDVLGEENVHTIERPSMGGEDFANYLHHVNGAMFRLGVAKSSQGGPPLHSPGFDIEESAMAIGAKILARAVVIRSLQ